MFLKRNNAFASALLLAFFIFSPMTVGAATVGFAETYTLPTGSSINSNAYLAGGTVIISGPVSGDATVAGGTASFSGIVAGDVLLAAGSAEMLGAVTGDLRALGGTLTIADSVGEDTALVGGVISLLESSEIAGDALLVGGKISLFGTIEGNVYIAGGDIFIDGTVAGNVLIFAAGKVHIGEHAVIGGDFTYRAADEALIESGAVITGKTSFEYVRPIVSAPDVRGFFAGLFGLLFIARILVLVAATLFFVLVFRRASGQFITHSKGNFWKLTLIGLAVFVSVPFASLILALTVFGGMIAAAAMAFWVLLLLVAQVYVGVLAAGVFRMYIMKRELEPLVSWQMAVLGALGINIICLVPYVGLFIYLVFLLATFGTLSSLGYRHFISSR